MASELTVQTLRGPTSGANADTVLIPSGQTLHAPGHVIQTIHSQSALSYSAMSSTSYAASGYTAVITPKFSNSKIYIHATWNSNCTTANDGHKVRIYRGTTNITSGNGQLAYTANGGSSNVHMPASLIEYDSPNTTSSVTYELYHGSQGGGTVRFANDWTPVSFILQEIAQ